MRINLQEISDILRIAVKQNLVDKDDTAIVFHDLSLMEKKINGLKILTEGIPCCHTSAVKANPLIKILCKLANLNFGAETASLPELYMAIKSGFKPENIVFDSPSKTVGELKYAIEQGVHINADSLEELKRIDSILNQGHTESTFGLRVNPQVGAGDIDITSVATKHSKFGVPLNSFRNQIIEAYKKYNWLTGIHLHIGSQGIPLSTLVEGTSKVFSFAEEINSILDHLSQSKRINIIDIGGGLPVPYLENRPAPTIEQYFASIKREVPGLFSGKYKIITEFGRYIHANTGWAISKVEYIKSYSDIINYVVIHLGADMFIRECYNRGNWPHEFSALTSEGVIKTGEKTRYSIAGPLCFAGDIIGENVSLPRLEPNDYIIIHDIGAYTYSMWSRYNSRQMPKIIGYYNNGESLEILKNREDLEKVYNYWK